MTDAKHRLEHGRLRRAVARLRDNYLVSEDDVPYGHEPVEDQWYGLFNWGDIDVHQADFAAADVVESALWSLRAALRQRGKERG